MTTTTFTIALDQQGRLLIMAQDGNSEDAAAQLLRILSELNAAGVEISDFSGVENHRGMSETVHSTVHQMLGGH